MNRQARFIDLDKVVRSQTRRKPLRPGDHGKAVQLAYSLMDRKRRPLCQEDAVLAAVERVRTTERRLSHGTGATGWK